MAEYDTKYLAGPTNTFETETWYQVESYVPSMKSETSGKISQARYIGFDITCVFPNSILPQNFTPVTFDALIDDLHITTIYSTIYTNTNSANSFGIREYKPDKNGYVEARVKSQFNAIGDRMLDIYQKIV